MSAPATVTGAMAPANVNGVMMSTCPALAKSMMPSAIGMSSCSGEFVLMTVQVTGVVRNCSGVKPCAKRSSSKLSAIWPLPRENTNGTLSDSRSWARVISRWRMCTGMSCGSTAPPSV